MPSGLGFSSKPRPVAAKLTCCTKLLLEVPVIAGRSFPTHVLGQRTTRISPSTNDYTSNFAKSFPNSVRQGDLSNRRGPDIGIRP